MISIIICSRKADIPQELKDNIAATIGCKYELCVIDNSRKEYNIFTAYNEGVHRAKGEILCFMHDDIRQFHTEGWGKNIENHFEKDAKLGLIGVQGTHFIPDAPFEWYHCYERSGVMMEVEETRKDIVYTTYNTRRSTPPKESIAEVVAVDGVFFCIRRELFDAIAFDKTHYAGWDFYDMDICMQVREAGYKVAVAYDVIIEHPWYGSYGQRWKEAGHAFYQKWHSQLPQMAGIALTEDELQIRTEIVRDYTQTLYAYIKIQGNLEKMQQSKAYRVGKALLSPFKWLKQRVKSE